MTETPCFCDAVLGLPHSHFGTKVQGMIHLLVDWKAVARALSLEDGPRNLWPWKGPHPWQARPGG